MQVLINKADNLATSSRGCEFVSG